MSKTAVIAQAEFGMLVRTKAFLITVLLMPVLVVGSILVQKLVGKQVDRTPRKVAVVDRAGVYDELAKLTAARNQAVALGVVPGARFDLEAVTAGGGPRRALPDGGRSNAEPPEPDETEDRLALSERVRRGEIFAFAEIPKEVLDPKAGARLRYYSDHPTYEDLRVWLDLTVNDLVRQRRLRAAGVDPDLVAQLDQRVPSEHLGLWTRGAQGEVQQARQVDAVRTYIVPITLMYILFLTIFLSAPQLLNSVLQEKMSKISEVLLGSVAPFELMMGKLLGSAGVSLVLAAVYLSGGLAVATYLGYGNVISVDIIVFFLLFLIMAVLLYGSIFIAVGAACTDLKDAQSLLTPVMLVVLMPMFALQPVLTSPGSSFAVGVSMFPTATPFLMLLRLALHPGPPWWQVAGAIAGSSALTMLFVWAAGKIFRVGILSQGKSAGFAQMIRWTMAK